MLKPTDDDLEKARTYIVSRNWNPDEEDDIAALIAQARAAEREAIIAELAALFDTLAAERKADAVSFAELFPVQAKEHSHYAGAYSNAAYITRRRSAHLATADGAK